jgi:hypothetical protein
MPRARHAATPDGVLMCMSSTAPGGRLRHRTGETRCLWDGALHAARRPPGLAETMTLGSFSQCRSRRARVSGLAVQESSTHRRRQAGVTNRVLITPLCAWRTLWTGKSSDDRLDVWLPSLCSSSALERVRCSPRLIALPSRPRCLPGSIDQAAPATDHRAPVLGDRSCQAKVGRALAHGTKPDIAGGSRR